MTIKGLFTNKIRHLKPVYLQTLPSNNGNKIFLLNKNKIFGSK